MVYIRKEYQTELYFESASQPMQQNIFSQEENVIKTASKVDVMIINFVHKCLLLLKPIILLTIKYINVYPNCYLS